MSGRDQPRKMFVFFLDPCNIDIVKRKIRSLALCVSRCPETQLRTYDDLRKFSQINVCVRMLDPVQYPDHPNKETKCPSSRFLPGGTGVLWWLYVDHRTSVNATLSANELAIALDNQKALLVYAIQPRSSRLFRVASKVFASLPLLVLQPFWTFLTLMLFWVYWITVLLLLGTAGLPDVQLIQISFFFIYLPLLLRLPFKMPPLRLRLLTSSVFAGVECRSGLWWYSGSSERVSKGGVWLGSPVKNNQTELVEFRMNGPLQYMVWYHAVGLIWISEFILACQQMTIAGAVVTYYFTRDKSQLPLTPVLSSVENACARCMLKACVCCLWCLEKCLSYLNQNAYVATAINSTSFCTSARDAFIILAENVLRVATINSVGDFVLFLGKVLIVSCTAFAGVLALNYQREYTVWVLPLIIVCVFAFLVSHCFLSVFEMVVDVLFLCFAIDTKYNDGSPGSEYYMDKALMEFVESNRKAETDSRRAEAGDSREMKPMSLQTRDRVPRQNQPVESSLWVLILNHHHLLILIDLTHRNHQDMDHSPTLTSSLILHRVLLLQTLQRLHLRSQTNIWHTAANNPSFITDELKLGDIALTVSGDDSGDECTSSPPMAGQGVGARNLEVQSTLRTLGSKVEDLSTCNDLIAKHGSALQRSLSELESIKLGGETSDKIRQVTERATLFRITSNAMINACRDFLALAQAHSKRWQKALQAEREQRVRLEETLEQLAKQHNHLERAFRGATVLPASSSNTTADSKGSAVAKGDASDDEENEFFDACEEFTIVPADPKYHRRSGSNVSGISSEMGMDDGTTSLDEHSLASNPESPQSQEVEPVRKRRTRIPDKPNYSLNLWSIMKNCIGKELSKIPMPVNFNEPISMLQRLSEDLEYFELLDRAAKCQSSLEQMCYVAAFTVSSYSTTVHRTGKPFNPLLGETFELDRLQESGYRSLCEQVSHHPPAAAHHAISERGWTLRQEITVASKFRGKYLSIMPLGSIHCIFQKSNNHYTWKKVTTTVHNIIVGKLWIDQSGEIDVINHRTGDRCHLKFAPYSYFSRDVARKVTGVVTDKDGKAHYVLSGTWDEKMECSRVMQSSRGGENGTEGRQKTVYQTLKARELWKKNPLLDGAENMYYFSSLALTLNEAEEGVAPTDSRRRPDQRLMEQGLWDEANAEKQRLEEKQRAVRREREREASQLPSGENSEAKFSAGRLNGAERAEGQVVMMRTFKFLLEEDKRVW
ncbi:Oxysterol-binding protein 1 [Bagarius yarrelli]|uniref:Oxysterol-binding protein n=1 Tax=Bagarius yarrelli TaxID=175774 RepID=A0A556VUS1_BAGYA|nr:Oxysterol-binding protein 1 [Bagarius yarrelli]